MPRRTPDLTTKARTMFEEELCGCGWEVGGTIPRIAEATGLSLEQARDAVFAPSADAWRQDLARRLHNA